MGHKRFENEGEDTSTNGGTPLGDWSLPRKSKRGVESKKTILPGDMKAVFKIGDVVYCKVTGDKGIILAHLVFSNHISYMVAIGESREGEFLLAEQITTIEPPKDFLQQEP